MEPQTGEQQAQGYCNSLLARLPVWMAQYDLDTVETEALTQLVSTVTATATQNISQARQMLTSGYEALLPTMTNTPKLETWIVLQMETLVNVGRAYWREKPNGSRRLVVHLQPRLPGFGGE